MPSQLAHNLPAPGTSLIRRERNTAETHEPILNGRLPMAIPTRVLSSEEIRPAPQIALDLCDTSPDGAWLVEPSADPSDSFIPTPSSLPILPTNRRLYVNAGEGQPILLPLPVSDLSEVRSIDGLIRYRSFLERNDRTAPTGSKPLRPRWAGAITWFCEWNE